MVTKLVQSSSRVGFILFLLCFSYGARSDVITLRADSWCPYNCDPRDLERPGFMVELAKAIFAIHGHSIGYKNLEWTKSIQETRVGNWNAILGALKSEAPDFIFPSNEQGPTQPCFYVKENESWRYLDDKTLDQLKSVGGIKGYFYGDELEAYFSKHKSKITRIDTAQAIDKNLASLLKGDLQAVLENSFVMRSRLYAKPAKVIEAGCGLRVPIYIAFAPTNPKSKEYSKILSDGMDQFRKNGKLQFILSRYGLKDWK